MHLEIIEPLVERAHSNEAASSPPSHTLPTSHHHHHHHQQRKRSPHILDRWLSWLSAADVKDTSSESSSLLLSSSTTRDSSTSSYTTNSSHSTNSTDITGNIAHSVSLSDYSSTPSSRCVSSSEFCLADKDPHRAVSHFACLSHCALATPPESVEYELLHVTNNNKSRERRRRQVRFPCAPSPRRRHVALYYHKRSSSYCPHHTRRLRQVQRTCRRLRNENAALRAELSALRASMQEEDNRTMCSHMEQGTQTCEDQVAMCTHDMCTVDDSTRLGEYEEQYTSCVPFVKPSHVLKEISSNDEVMSYCCSTPGITSAAAKPSVEAEMDHHVVMTSEPERVPLLIAQEDNSHTRLPQETLPFTYSRTSPLPHSYHSHYYANEMNGHTTPSHGNLLAARSKSVPSDGSTQRAAQSIARAERCLQEMNSSSRKLAELVGQMQHVLSSELAQDESDSGDGELVTSATLSRELQY